MDYLDFLDIVAILLGIAFTIAKLDAQSRKPEQFPQVAPADFERWRNVTASIYRLGSSMCFARVLVHQALAFYVRSHPLPVGSAGNPARFPPELAYPAMAVDLAFVAVLVLTFLRAGRARALRRELGIVLAPLTPAQAAALAPDKESEREAPDEDQT